MKHLSQNLSTRSNSKITTELSLLQKIKQIRDCFNNEDYIREHYNDVEFFERVRNLSKEADTIRLTEDLYVIYRNCRLAEPDFIVWSLNKVIKEHYSLKNILK